MTRADKYIAEKLLEVVHAKGLIWTGTFKELARKIQNEIHAAKKAS